jgi:hypothetical protein
VPTVAEFVAAPGRARRVIMDGGPERVSFEPPTADVSGDFVGRGARDLLRGWDVLLFALCLGLAVTARPMLRRAAACWLGVQAAAALLAGAGIIPPGLPLPLLHALSASVVVIAALLGLLGGAAWMVPLAAIFGLAQGLAAGDAFTHIRGFAGDHAAVALVAFSAAALLGSAWMLAVVGAVAGWLRSRGLPARVVTAVACLVALHNALHLADTQATAADAATVATHPAVVGLVVIWLAAAVIAGWMATRRAPASARSEVVS